ncbi:MAG: DUF368 domain-containing protein [Candidatus Izemoplasmatales bacterium]|jgi:putative membrane protein|nr:DUF368 domain-containing protein [Candidatus Izemoplasmatales bacterium]
MFLILLLKGFIMGVAFLIPGVSGGTLAVYLGIYQKMIDAISNIFKDFKNSFKYLLPIFLGIGISIVSLAALLSWLLDINSFMILFFFIGLVVGGVKFIYKKTEPSKINLGMILSFSLSFLLLLLIVILDKTGSNVGVSTFDFSFWTYILILVLGIIASITMIVPGISGSAVLLVLGYYSAILYVVKNIFDFSSIGYNLQVILPFALGAVIGILLFSKLIGFLLKKYPKQTYAGILGFILASVIGIFLEIKNPSSGINFSNQLPIYENYLTYFSDNIWSIFGGILTFSIGFIASKYLAKFEGKTNNEKS